MKALSLTQPWATAIVIGLKTWETRSWPTNFRGDVCIHASKGFPRWAREFAAKKGIADIPLGAIVCVANLTACRQTDTVVTELSAAEQEWGDYTDGRFAFKLENIRVLKQPIIAKGSLGFWSVPWDVAKEISATFPGRAWND